MILEEFLEGFLDQEAALVRQWGSMDPAYADNAWELRTSAVAKKKDLGGAVAWERLRLPDSVTNAPLAAPNSDAAAQGDRFARRRILRADSYEVPAIGSVQAFTTSYGDITAPDDDTRPAVRFAVANLGGQPRILRADSPCTQCYATGGGSGQGCGFVDEADAECHYGWLSRGGAALGLGRADAMEHRLRPADSRWHAWYEG